MHIDATFDDDSVCLFVDKEGKFYTFWVSKSFIDGFSPHRIIYR